MNFNQKRLVDPKDLKRIFWSISWFEYSKLIRNSTHFFGSDETCLFRFDNTVSLRLITAFVNHMCSFRINRVSTVSLGEFSKLNPTKKIWSKFFKVLYKLSLILFWKLTMRSGHRCTCFWCTNISHHFHHIIDIMK